MGSLYVVGVPAVDADDLTLRARRILEQVTRVITDDLARAQSLLSHHGIGTPLAEVRDIQDSQELWATHDHALLYSGQATAQVGPTAQLIKEAAEVGIPVVPIPGPDLRVTALVLSGFPADSFIYLGEVPANLKALTGLLSPVTGEPRTLLAEAALEEIDRILGGLRDLLGDRPMAIVTAQEGEGLKAWRGTLEEAITLPGSLPDSGNCSLIIGGLRGEPESWDEGQVRAQVQELLRQGLGVKEISQALSAESGWARRDVYALAVKVRKGLQR